MTQSRRFSCNLPVGGTLVWLGIGGCNHQSGLGILLLVDAVEHQQTQRSSVRGSWRGQVADDDGDHVRKPGNCALQRASPALFSLNDVLLAA